MGIEMELDFEKNCTSDLSPNTVLPQRNYSSIAKRRTDSKSLRRDDILRVKEGFTEISFRRYRSSSCKNAPSRTSGSEDNVELKRGSIYQSSGEVRKMKKMGSNERTRKIELSRDSESSLSFRIVDSLCGSDEEDTQKRSPSMLAKWNLNQMSVSSPCKEPCSSAGYFEICPELENRGKQSPRTVRFDSIENLKFRREEVVDNLNDGNNNLERDIAPTFHKSLSAKVEMLHIPSESDFSARASSKSRFSPIRKMFDPFKKSKSLRSPLGYIAEPGDIKTTGMANVIRNQMFQKSLSRDFSNTAQKSDLNSVLVKKDDHHSVAACSPVHLHGCLKLEKKNGVPFYEFSLNCPEEVIVAKTWKANNAFSWAYTFHSVCNRKRNNASGCRLFDGNKESSLLGQMQVSCYLCSEFKDGVLDNSMVTEFVLYDIMHARQRVSSQDSSDFFEPSKGSNPGLVGGARELDDSFDALRLKHQQKHAFHNGSFDLSNSYPWASAVLHPGLETAAIVIQFPFSKRESLKCKRGKMGSDKMHSNLLKLSTVEQNSVVSPHGERPGNVKVVIPSGNHSLPSVESRGPSSLLDRWRSGGGCDCGGWDTACPLTVIGSNAGIQFAEDEPLINKERPLQLFFQGTRESMPALSITVVEERQYAVDFHAQLTTLQAFSICVAMLHGSVASSGFGQDRSKQLPHSNSSLKMLIEEEVKFLIEAVTEEDKKKAPKKIDEIQQSYVPNPPFSPIARV